MQGSRARAIVGRMLRWGAAAYALLSIGIFAGSWLWLGRLPLSHQEPWLDLPTLPAQIYSLLLGLAFGSALVVSSRVCVSRFVWAKRLHNEFRPIARQLSSLNVLLLALLSAVGEELLFRGLLQPYLGLWLQALIFGFLHQMPGPSRWVWATWAASVGLGLGAIFQLTGSLLGPVVAHALVNALNLSYLKHHEFESSNRSLGGLLDRRTN